MVIRRRYSDTLTVQLLKDLSMGVATFKGQLNVCQPLLDNLGDPSA